ncbi:MAG: sugar phosphate isomerase/epimerase [Clostridia bacterium]|nr:sugar phosphate isomerase/epimerase [Clostridia bacterium]
MDKKIKLCAFADEASNDLKGQIDALKRNNIGLLEIRGVDKENIKDISYEKIKEIKKQLDENEIKVWSLGSPVGKYELEDDFCKQLDEFKKLCEFCEILECQRIRMFSFYSKDEDRVFDRLETLCSVAPDNVILCHENEKDIFGDDIEGCVKIHEAFPRIKGVFDPANFVQCDVDTLKAWEKLGKYVDYMHVKDALKDKRVVKAGFGIGNVEKIIKMYTENGGTVLTLEPHLMEFYGLSRLENGQSINHTEVYKDENAAFDAGACALKNILDKLELRY